MSNQKIARQIFVTMGLLFAPCLTGSLAWGLAGFSESTSELQYADHLILQWNHPSDGCDGGGTYCFYLAGIPGSLDKINVPPSQQPSLVMAQRQRDKSWILFDVPTKHVVLETPDKASAVAEWRRRGQAEPIWAQANDPHVPFSRTWKSVAANLIGDVLIAFFFLGGPVLLVCGGPYAIWKLTHAYRAYDRGQAAPRPVILWAIPAVIWLLLLMRPLLRNVMMLILKK
jgi:hypothetical protein